MHIRGSPQVKKAKVFRREFRERDLCFALHPNRISIKILILESKLSKLVQRLAVDKTAKKK